MTSGNTSQSRQQIGLVPADNSMGSSTASSKRGFTPEANFSPPGIVEDSFNLSLLDLPLANFVRDRNNYMTRYNFHIGLKRKRICSE